jgi:hypothetical protein
MEMPRGIETGQFEFPHGKGIQLTLGDQLKLGFVWELHGYQTLILSVCSSKPNPCQYDGSL